MLPIIKWELSQRKMAILWWSVSAVVLVTVLMLVYPSIRDQAEQLNKVLNQLPSGLRQLKTGGTNVDVASPVGYLNSQLYYATLPIVLIILAIQRGSGLIGKDEQDHTIELLLARPVRRSVLLLGKAISGLLEVLAVTAVVTLAILGLAKLVKMDIGTSRVLITSLYTFAFCASFGAIAFALTAADRLTKRASTAIAILLSFGGYILASLQNLSHYMKTPAKFAPYHYFVPDKTLQGQGVTGLNIYLIGIFIITIVLAYTSFRSRDIE
ncbi:MAG TPA: ABC transporter permease subunit [Candidatus Saccharimonadales bacterium]|nr:ABC transporter permease subunit [Candidatus Saccharimonadales bacterium]